MSKTIFETTCIAPGDRVPGWSQALSGLCGPMKVAGYGASASIDGRIEIRTLTKLKLSRIVASAHQAIAEMVRAPNGVQRAGPTIESSGG